ncbi:MAG: PBP1A family penicillin-binding protein [Candidatus Marinimicrobia bacterium]|nr:PBP1A family penicillin-binding protein [Candidatus Neomarinimicrobiota bacterium]
MGRKSKYVRQISWIEAFFWVIIIYIIGSGILLGVIAYFSQDLPSPEQLQNINPELVTRIYSADGKILQELFVQRRVYVPIEKIPIHMRKAVISVEDTRFYKHWGFSLRDFLRAVIIDIATLSKKQGASTISQQLARILYENIGYEKTVVRKIKELLTAIEIEKRYSKDEILEMYLNSTWFGHGVYGVQAASKRYFDKNCDKLTVDESALLAGLIRNSYIYSPILHPENAFRRRNVVLALMRENGFISDEDFAIYKNTPLFIQKPEPPAKIAPYFVEFVRQQLNSIAKKYKFDIYRDGLSIYTTLDTRIQEIADSVTLEHLKWQQSVLNKQIISDPESIIKLIPDSTITPEKIVAMVKGEIPMDSTLQSYLTVQCALTAIDHKTGRILAMIGGRNFRESQFNRAVQAKRQPGSVFKPIVYVTAIDNGFPVTTQLLNQPVVVEMEDGTRWAPKNYDLATGGPTTLREALKRSLNLVTVRIVQELIQPKSVVETARRMHLTTYIPAVDAIALGAASVKPIEITSAYGIFANYGIWNKPYAIEKIVDRYGNIIYEHKPVKDFVFSKEVAYVMISLLESVLNEGTAKNARRIFGFKHPGGAKTGTTNNFSDAWLVGFTPYLTAGVWVGIDNPSVSLGHRQSGAVAALPIWAKFMKIVHKEMGWYPREFQRPENVIEVKICKETKLLATPYCPVETEIFIKGTEPKETCPIHGKIRESNIEDKIIF